MGENTITASCPKISVIIPVYNTEPYLRECIDSITGQTLRDLEVIVVDDGSRDGSLALLQDMAAHDQRIKVVSQPNGGAAVARNHGLDIACGEYVHFMDSDDFLEPDALELCCKKCDEQRLDFVIFDAIVMNEIPGFTFNYRRTDRIEDKIYTGLDLLDVLLAMDGYTVQPSLNVIRRSFLDGIALRYFPVMHEDELFSALLYMPAKRVGCIDRAFFHRRIRPESIMTSAFTARRIDSYLKMLDQFAQYEKGKDQRTQAMTRTMMSRIVNGLMHNAAKIPFTQRMRLMRAAVTKYPSLVAPKSLMVLALPSSIKFKQMFKSDTR